MECENTVPSSVEQKLREYIETDEPEDGDDEEIDLHSIESDPMNVILCIIYCNSCIGAAYYDLNSSQLYVLSDMGEYGPQFIVIRLLLRLINPIYIVAVGNTCEEHINCIIDSLNGGSPSISSSDQLKNIPPNLFLLSYQEYSYEACKHRLFDIDLIVNKNRNFDGPAKEVYLYSIIDFDNKLSVHALAALIKFIEHKRLHIHSHKDQISFMDISQTSLQNYTFIDHVSINALQIFENKIHASAFKRQEENTREGFSLYKMFSQYCKTKSGCITARNLMMNPVSKLETLNLRLDFIEFASNPKYKHYIEDLQECIKFLCDIQTHLLKIQHSRAKGRNWKKIYNTIYNTLLIQESAKLYRNECDLLKQLSECVTEPLYGLEHCIKKAIDLDDKNLIRRPLIRNGLDENLDAKRIQRECISKNITAAAKCMIDMMAANVDVKLITYIPDVGHMLVTRERIENKELDLHLFFQLKGYYHYKNSLCEELDNQLGDIQQDILAHENQILQNLTNIVIEKSVHLYKPLEYLSLIDCLISVAKVSVQRGFVRPILNQEGIYNIVQGRHPLLDLYCTDYVRNDWKSSGTSSKLKIITGPNGSGKTVYLKQIGVLVYLAHLGFYISAESANISITDSIFSRLYAMESASLTLSSFQIDLTQMGHILSKAKGNSLVLIDEFGKGSFGTDGLHLLAGSIRIFLERTTDCPHMIISTHYDSLSRYLPPSPIISFHQMRFKMNESEMPIFLFKVDLGYSGSYAIEVARSIGMKNTEILDDSEDLLYCIISGSTIKNKGHNIHNQFKDLSSISVNFLDDVKIPEIDN